MRAGRSARSSRSTQPVTPTRTQTATGTVIIEPDPDRASAATLWVDGVPQSYLDLADPGYLGFEYVRQIGDVIDIALPPGPVRALHLGGGGLTLPRYVAATRPRSRQRVVELDGGLVALVRDALPIDPRHKITITVDDARSVLERVRPRSADLVVVDVFASGRVPANLVSVEACRLLAVALGPDGVAVLNIADGSGLAFARSVVATIKVTFAHVVALAEPSVWRGRRFGNVVIAASHQPLPESALARRLAGGVWPARLVAGQDLDAFAGRARPRTDSDVRPTPVAPTGAFDALAPSAPGRRG